MAKYLQSNDNIEIESIDDGLYLKLVHTKILDLVYPIGSIYLSTNSNSPSTFLGGTWERIQDKFLLASGSTYSAGSTGGEETHKLTIDEMPKHTHSIKSGNKNNTWVAPNGVLAYQYQGETALISDEWTVATGGDQPHNNMPPYLAVYVWKRTA